MLIPWGKLFRIIIGILHLGYLNLKLLTTDFLQAHCVSAIILEFHIGENSIITKDMSPVSHRYLLKV